MDNTNWQWIRKSPYYESMSFKDENVDIEITLEEVGQTCDRGRWLAKVEAKDLKTLVSMIDHHDGWPRYYFEYDAAKFECEIWLEMRLRQYRKPELIEGLNQGIK